MRSRISLAKPKLIFIQYIIGVNKINKMIVYNFLKYFRKGVKNRDWPKVERSVLSPYLYIGMTFATLRSSGKTPVSNDLLIIYDNGLIYSSMYGLSSLAGRLSYPGLLLVSDDTTVIISHSVITGTYMLFITLFVTYDMGLTVLEIL